MGRHAAGAQHAGVGSVGLGGIPVADDESVGDGCRALDDAGQPRVHLLGGHAGLDCTGHQQAAGHCEQASLVRKNKAHLVVPQKSP
jgi:hypothetical protein